MKNKRNNRKGFGLVETVICIVIAAILGASVFAGGAAAIKKSQISRTSSDLHNFSVALEAFLNETPQVANCSEGSYFADFIKAINLNLPSEYKIKETPITNSALTSAINGSGGNITVDTVVDATKAHVAVYESEKTDAWGNHYYLILDDGERHGKDNSDFYITVVSAGADAKTQLAGKIGGDAEKIDDVFLLVQYTNGDVSAVVYATSSAQMKYCSDMTTLEVKELDKKDARYAEADDGDYNTSVHKCPVNF